MAKLKRGNPNNPETKLTTEQIRKIKAATTDSKKAEDVAIDDINQMENTIKSMGYKLTESGDTKFNKGSLSDFLDVWNNLEKYIELKDNPIKKIVKNEAPIVKAEPKKIDFSAPKMKLKTPIEEKILDILNTRSGGGRRVETNYGSRDYNGNLGIKQFAQWVKDNRGKVDEYRANRK